MDPGGDPQAMVSYCIFAPELWGQGAATTALGLFLEEIRARFGLERIGALSHKNHSVCGTQPSCNPMPFAALI